jgi:hypothetical protein
MAKSDNTGILLAIGLLLITLAVVIALKLFTG